jgi:D-mannonate dehydratase
MSMTEDEAREIIQAVAEADYDGEPFVTREQAETVLQAATSTGYSSIDDIRGAVEVLGMSSAAQAYIDELTACHRAEYRDEVS